MNFNLTKKELVIVVDALEGVMESGGSSEASKFVKGHNAGNSRKPSPQCKLRSKALRKLAPKSQACCPDCGLGL